MPGRRSHPRFVVATQWDGAMRVLRDVTLERAGCDALLAVCETPGVRDEDLSLELLGGTRTLAFDVRVLGSRPVVIDGALRHQVELGRLPATALPQPTPRETSDGLCPGSSEQPGRRPWGEMLDLLQEARDLPGVLGRVVQVRVADISVSGCLLESARRLDKDTTGVLRIQVDEDVYADDIRVVRAGVGRPGGLHQSGSQFLWTSSPGEHSLRRLVAKLQGVPYRTPPLPPPAPGLGSGSPGTDVPISKSAAWRPLRNPSKP